MRNLYSAPLRVYLMLLGLALAGLYAGWSLPVSLFPNSSKPTISIYMELGSSTAEEFLHAYGEVLEAQIHSIETRQLHVEQIRASYNHESVYYAVEFEWGSPDADALREIQTVVNGFSARLPTEIRNSVQIWSSSDNSGFISISFSSPTRTLDQIYDALDPILAPRLARVTDAADPGLYNPAHKDIQVELNPARIASMGLLPKDVNAAIESGLYGASGGFVATAAQRYTVQMPRALQRLSDVGMLPVKSSTGSSVHLGDIAKIEYAVRPEGVRSYTVDGIPSIILWAEPKAGGNVKKMSEDIIRIVEESRPLIPADIQYKVIVDPSAFIRSAVQNVLREVAIGGLLSVAILFLFIGSLRNTITAAIEIPLSMVLAFIPMKLLGMNLNLISLGGLALSAGMNVDASVVVMENIFRHFEELKDRRRLSAEEKLEIVLRSVAEVRFSVIASTICSLVVFLPLAFTSNLTNAVLGDLAKAVVFSHGFSAIVALILVPTVRLHLMSRGNGSDAPPVEVHHSPIQGLLTKIETFYVSCLGEFLKRTSLKFIIYACLIATLFLLMTTVLPALPREIIGTPDTDWIKIGVTAIGNTRYRQMENQAREVEARFLKDFSDRIQYTYVSVQQPNYANVMGRLKDKSQIHDLWREMEKKFTNTPLLRFQVQSWNPAELPIPNPPQLKLAVQGGTVASRAEAARSLDNLLEENHILPRIWAEPDVSHSSVITLKPDLNRWVAFQGNGPKISPTDLAEIVRVATAGAPSSIEIPIEGKNARVFLHFPDSYIKTPEDIGSIPVGVSGKLIPLRGLMQVSIETALPTIYRENGREINYVIGRQNLSSDGKTIDHSWRPAAERSIEKWRQNNLASSTDVARDVQPTVTFVDAEKDLNDALRQLSVAVVLSIVLIFLTLVIQFGDFMNALIVLVSIPLGLIGVLLSLYIFGSTLSLNSVLGVILLNGIAVANSIILVDFQKKLVTEGASPLEAALESGRKRLKPILITSLTTILAMLPVALGFGEGGRILQPLGIAVAGGFWVSMGFTLFVVPALQTSYLERKIRLAN